MAGMIHENITSWHMSNIRSPTESVDSGVELSPRTTSAYSSYDNDCSQILSDVHCQGSPTYSSGSVGSAIEEQTYGYNAMSPEYTATYSPPLTEGELDALSDCSDCLTFSPCPTETQTELTEIGQFDFHSTGNLDVQANGYHQATDAAKAEASVSLGTIKRKRRLKARQLGLCEAHPGVDPCLVPKSGTAKPRQSRKRKLEQKESPMAGGQGATMNPKKCYSGARVKETAREKLQRLRSMQNSEGVMEQKPRSHSSSGDSMSPPQQPRTSQILPKIERQVVGGQGDHGFAYTSLYAAPQSSCSVNNMGRQYFHSVEEILSETAQYHQTAHHLRQEFLERKDNLDQIIEQILMRQNTSPLKEYIEQAMSTTNRTGQTPIHNILHKLNQKVEIYSFLQIKQVMDQVCSVLPEVINRTNLKGETPIYLAALYGNVGAVQSLMESGADPWIQEKSGGETALLAAVKSKNTNVVEIILSKREDPRRFIGINATTYDGNTALHRATALRNVDLVVQKKIVIDLLEANADASIKNNMSQMAHSFLPDELKELQSEMKKLNGRKKAAHAHQMMSPNAESSSYGRFFQPQYPQFTPEMLHAHLTRPSSSYTSQHKRFEYPSHPQSSKGFTPAPSMPFTQMDAFASQMQHPSLSHYAPRTAVTNSNIQLPTSEHLPQDVVDELFQNLNPEVPPEA